MLCTTEIKLRVETLNFRRNTKKIHCPSNVFLQVSVASLGDYDKPSKINFLYIYLKEIKSFVWELTILKLLKLAAAL